MPSDWYFQYKAIENEPTKFKAKIIAADNGKIKIIPEIPQNHKPFARPKRYTLPFDKEAGSANKCSSEEYLLA